MNRYLQRHTFCPAQITEAPSPQTGIIVVIPCYNEPNLLATLASLWACTRPNVDVEVLVVLNASSRAPENAHLQNKQTAQSFETWTAAHQDPHLRFYLLDFPDLPKKHAGVGLTRKIGMDEAVARFASIDRPDGVIANIDADCDCHTNYLTELAQHFDTHPEDKGCVIHYEHPIEADDTLSEVEARAIQLYELHLRVYVHALRYAGFPHAYQTVGSSFAVRSQCYQEVGGMNKRQAGEDFYFLQKVFQTDACHELHTTCVIPSARISDRVPFGTGRAIGDMLSADAVQFDTYALETFEDIAPLLKDIRTLYTEPSTLKTRIASCSSTLQDFLRQQDFVGKWEKSLQETSSYEVFCRRFLGWWNAFTMMKWAHYARDHAYPNQPVEEIASKLIQKLLPTLPPSHPLSHSELPADAKTQLKWMRTLDRERLHPAPRL
ncbi:MAG TPA: hypothetical protein DCE42_27600 [Myxococcales bacterium]|nr:hypothetical protein [Deltaproteobacteria bacterium]HAA58559.1 hypothetical protein [Myxococcales bacterium]